MRRSHANGARGIRSVKAYALFLSVCVLSACTNVEYRDRIVYEEVLVPVSVPCVDAVPYPAKLEKPGDTEYDMIRAIVIDRYRLLAQQKKLRAMLKACLN